MISTLQADIAGFLTFFGRFHPLMVHLPIGFLLAALALEIFSKKKQFALLQHAVSFVLALTALSAVVTAVMGYWLSISGDYDQESVFWHKWLGIGLAVFCVVAWWSGANTKSTIRPPGKRAILEHWPYLLCCWWLRAMPAVLSPTDRIISLLPCPIP